MMAGVKYDIDQIELQERCDLAIRMGLTPTSLFYRLKGEGRSISFERLSRVWYTLTIAQLQ